MSVLVHTQIEDLVWKIKLIDPYDPSGLQGASYDMRLGKQYAKGGNISSLTRTHPTLNIEPGEFALVSTYETLRMPNNLVGHNGIMSTWAKKGLTSLFSPQIDPGFQGILIVPVFNAGDTRICLTFQDQIFTVEFNTTEIPAEYGWSEKNRRVQKSLDNQIPIPITSSPRISEDIRTEIRRISASVQNLENERKAFEAKIDSLERTLNMTMASLAIIAAIGGIVASILFGG